MAISLPISASSSVVANNVPAVNNDALARVHEELAKGNPLVFKLELNSSLDAVAKIRAGGPGKPGRKLASTISTLGGSGYLMKTSTREGAMYTHQRLLPKTQDANGVWIDKPNHFLALSLLGKEAVALTSEQVDENEWLISKGKAPKHSSQSAVITEKLVSKPQLKDLIARLLRATIADGADDNAVDQANAWLASGNEDVHLNINYFERFISMDEVQAQPGLITVYFTLWNTDADRGIAPNDKTSINKEEDSKALTWSPYPLAITFEANKTCSIKRPVRVVDESRSQAMKAWASEIFSQPATKQAMTVVSSSVFEEVNEYNLSKVKKGNKGHHQFRDELFNSASKGEWNAKAEQLLLEIAASDEHPKFDMAQCQTILSRAKALFRVNTAESVAAPAAISSVVATVAIVEEEEVEDPDFPEMETLDNLDASEFFAAAQLSAMYNLNGE